MNDIIEELEPDKGISWTTKEYPYQPKDSDWYTSVIIITAGLVISSIIFGNYILAILISIGAFSLLLLATKKPQTIDVDLNIDGVYIGNIFYPYKNLESFNISQDGYLPKLILQSKKTLSPLITIEIEGVNANEVGDYLALFLEEDEDLDDPLIFKLIEKMGF